MLRHLRQRAVRQLTELACRYGRHDLSFRRFDEMRADCPRLEDGRQHIGWWAYLPDEDPWYLGWSLNDALACLHVLLGPGYQTTHPVVPLIPVNADVTRTQASLLWLKACLRDGPRTSVEVQAMARQSGLSLRTLQRVAKGDPHITIRRNPPGSKARTTWVLAQS